MKEIYTDKYMELAAKEARDATCLRSKCGSVIVKSEKIIGRGFNSPPANTEEQRRCRCLKSSYHPKVTDKTCCMHAEQRAIIDALQNHPKRLVGSRLYFVRLDKDNQPQRSGQPYCTICSKMALDVGIAEFVLWQKEGIQIFDTFSYNTLSYQYTSDKSSVC